MAAHIKVPLCADCKVERPWAGMYRPPPDRYTAQITG